jgi:hypothetical protein
MSKVALSGNASGTGTFTIASPNSNTDRTLNLPDSSGTVATAESTLTQFNASGSAPVYACRAWVNFNGTGTVAIRASGNVSSITDNGTGDYTVNFTTAMSDANYAVTGIGSDYLLNLAASSPLTTTSARMNAFYVSGTTGQKAFFDLAFINVAIFR